MKRRSFLQILGALGLSSYASPLFAKENFEIYGAPALPSLIIATAFLQGKIGQIYDARLKIWKTPDQLRAGVASGEYKVMMSPSNVGVNLANKGQNVGMVNILAKGIGEILSKKPLKEFGDLQGKKLIMPFKNDMPDITIRALFKKLGIDINKIDITYAATPPLAMTSFLTKDFDALYMIEPLSSACILKGKKLGVNVVRNFNIPKSWGEAFDTKAIIPQAGIIANVDYFNAHKEAFSILNEDLKNALKWLKANPSEGAKIGTNFFPAPAKAIEFSIPHSNLGASKASEVKEEIIKFFEILMEFNPKLLGGKLPKDDYFLC